MFLRAWPVSAVQLKWSAKVTSVIARRRRSVSETMCDGKQRHTRGVKKRGKFWSGRFPDPNLLIVALPLHRAIYYFAYFAPFLKEAKGAKAVTEQKKKEGGGGGLVKTRLN